MRYIPSIFAAFALLTAASPSLAQQYPTRPLRIVLGFPAGGPTDAAARILAQALAAPLGQSLIVDNRPGADGAIGPEVVAKAPSDGHTLLIGSSSNMAGVPAMRKRPTYDTLTDFVPVAFVSWSSSLLVSSPSVPAKTLGELVAYARANPGKVVVAAANPGTILTMAQINAMNKTEMISAGYKGDANAMPDLLAGRAHVVVGGTNLVLPYVKEGKLRALAALTRTRTRPAPDVPTIVEAGVTRFGIYGWFAFFAPAKTPPAVVERLDREITAVLARPEIQAQFEKIGFETGGGPTRGELPAFFKEQIAAWREGVKLAGIQPQ